MSVATDLRTRFRYGAVQTPGGPLPPAHIGDARPTAYAEIRIGRLRHAYDVWEGPPTDAFVAGGFIRNSEDDLPAGWPEGPIGGFGQQFWQNFWTPEDGDDGVFTGLPGGDYEWEIQQAFQNNGIEVLTLSVENIAYPEVAGPGGTYHAIKRGYLAPNRGFVPANRAPVFDHGVALERNEWFRKLNSGSCQIKLWAGYGDALVPVFTGLLDDADTEAHPDRISLTARSFGQSLTDMRLFGWNKEPRIKDPVTFQDRLVADQTQKVGYDADATTWIDGHEPARVLSTAPDQFWVSHQHDGPNFTEWIEIKVPAGRYESFFLYPRYTGMDIWISVYAQAGSTLDGVPLDEGWVDTHDGQLVPGGNGGIPFVRHREGMPAKGEYWGLRGQYVLAAGSKIRAHFRNLRPDSLLDKALEEQLGLPPGSVGRVHRAGVNRMFALKRQISGQAERNHWVLVEDVADMVRVVLRWAGFKEWDVEQTGVRLKAKQVFPRSNTYMDVIKKAQELTGYVFFMRPPTTADMSIGIPVFRMPTVVEQEDRVIPRVSLRDTDLLTGIRIKESDEPRPYIIRVRGRTAKASDGGIRLNSADDDTRRLMFTFKPPGFKRLGGIVKHVVYTNHSFKTDEQCQFAAYFIALQGLLEAFQGTCQMPALPSGEDETNPARPRFGVELDTHASVFDVGTGLTTRIWVSELTTSFRNSEQGAHFSMALSGSLVDTPEIRRMVEIINDTPRSSE